jgi:hypothetical protein
LITAKINTLTLGRRIITKKWANDIEQEMSIRVDTLSIYTLHKIDKMGRENMKKGKNYYLHPKA